MTLREAYSKVHEFFMGKKERWNVSEPCQNVHFRVDEGNLSEMAKFIPSIRRILAKNIVEIEQLKAMLKMSLGDDYSQKIVQSSEIVDKQRRDMALNIMSEGSLTKLGRFVVVKDVRMKTFGLMRGAYYHEGRYYPEIFVPDKNGVMHIIIFISGVDEYRDMFAHPETLSNQCAARTVYLNYTSEGKFVPIKYYSG